MSYVAIALSDLNELKNRRGNSTSTTIATILGLNYPMVEAYSVYWWDNTSTATGDDDEIVEPILGTTGRWFKIDLDQAPQANVDWNASSGVTQILNKPTLANVATSGDYNDLSNQPDLSPYYLSSNPAGYITSIPAQDWSTITNKPTNLSGYGITDPVVLTSGSYSNPTWITSLAYSKLTGTPTIPSNTSQISESGNLYYTDSRSRNAISLTTSGSGTATYDPSTGALNIPTPTSSKRIETYTGTTDASGNFTITYSSAFTSTPYVNAVLLNPTTQQLVRLTSSSTTGFTVNATNRATVNLLATDLLLGNTTALVGASVHVLVIGN